MTKNLDSSFYLPHAGRDDDPEQTQGGDSLPLLVGRKTPRTDAEYRKTLTKAFEFQDAEFEAWAWARTLERENIRLREERDTARREWSVRKDRLAEAHELLAEIMRGEVNAEDEAEKWLRAYCPQLLHSSNVKAQGMDADSEHKTESNS